MFQRATRWVDPSGGSFFNDEECVFEDGFSSELDGGLVRERFGVWQLLVVGDVKGDEMGVRGFVFALYLDSHSSC
jgi:hypothetical protein